MRKAVTMFADPDERIMGPSILEHSSIEYIEKDLRDLRRSDRTIVIGIEGFGGSGKSTIAARLRDALVSAAVVHMDSFIVKDKVLEPSWDNGAFDHTRLREQVLIPAREGLPVEYQAFLWHVNKLSDAMIQVPAVEFLVVEGISAYHPIIASYYDDKIWVDTPIEVARERGRARDADNENEAHWDLWAENDLRYLEAHRSDRVADAILSNTKEQPILGQAI